MGFGDYIIIAVILAFCFYILYHSLWKKKGHCHGCSCDSGSCGETTGRARAKG